VTHAPNWTNRDNVPQPDSEKVTDDRPTETHAQDEAGSSRLGLVLEGGGAKGAFQFGCLYALHEKGVAFDAVAGTSAGALNAAIWSTGQMEWGKEFWENITLNKIYPLRKPEFVFVPVALFYAILKFFGEWVSKHHALRISLMFAQVWCLLCWIALIIIFLLYFISMIFSGQYHPLSLEFRAAYLILMSAPPIYIFIFEFLGLSAFASNSLKTTLTNQINGRSFNIPTFVTTARAEEIYDPDNLRYQSTGMPPSSAISIPSSEPRFIPEYLRIDVMAEGMVEALLATAALPYGIVPSISGTIDGGLADNTPVFPLITSERCQNLLVIRCRPDTLDVTNLGKHWSDIDRLLRIVKYTSNSALQVAPNVPPELKYLNTHPTRRGQMVEEPRSLPFAIKVISIAREKPSWTLWGDFIGGTMNFRARYTRRQFLAGYRKTRSLLKTGHLDEFLGIRSATAR
jgi:predicted acylesterase/phospholipase RssA